MALEGRLFGGSKIDEAFGFIDSLYAENFPVALSQLRKLLAVKIVQIEVAVAGALIAPQETLAVLEKAEIVADVDPILILHGDRGARFAGAGVGDQKIKNGLFAIQALNGQVLGIHQPV